ncbi:MAG: cell division protein FtsZ [Candidatus Micrarchaeaceae archaeon]
MNNFDMDDEDLFKAKIAVVGAGGQGSNLVNRLYNNGLKSATTIAVNTDAKHLNMIKADKKVLIGKEITRGLGAGGFPEVGMKAAEASQGEILETIKGYDMVFVSAGMGGGTGGGSAPVIAKLAKEEGALVVGFVTYPFSLERSRKTKADWSLEQLRKNADTTIIVENDRLLSYAPNLPVEKSFELVDNIAYNAVKGITDVITLPSLINVDFADLRAVLRDGGTAVINLGFGNGTDRVQKAIKSTLSHPLLNVDITNGKSAMIHVTGGTSMTIDEATKIGRGITEKMDAKANVIFGSRLSPEMNDQIRVMSIVTGVTPNLSEGIPKSVNAEYNGEFLLGVDKIY